VIYLDYGATSFHKPREVARAVSAALQRCASPGRGGYGPALEADRQVYRCREEAAALFDCLPEQVVLTMNCTHGLNIAIKSLFRPGARVVISGFEHNAVLRPLHDLGCEILVAGRKLFDWEDTLEDFRRCLDRGVDGAVFTHVSNVFGYILPVGELARLCRSRGVPFILDAAQSAGTIPLSFRELGADFVAMPGHKGLLGPQGTGLLLCSQEGKPLLLGGTGGNSRSREMPRDLPERLEAGTMNVPGIAGLAQGMAFLRRTGVDRIFRREHKCLEQAVAALIRRGLEIFAGEHQAATLSFRMTMDCEEAARLLAREGIALRPGLHCAPLAHESAGTDRTGTLRLSFGWDSSGTQVEALTRALQRIQRNGNL